MRQQILELTRAYYTAKWGERSFTPGQSAVPASGRVFDADELESLVDSSLDFWLTTGRFAETFEREFARAMGVRFALLVNSGSSANLLAVTALTDDSLGDRRLQPGDEVITVAAGFPTTVNPIIQNGCVPVFVDVELGTYNIDVSALEAALSPKTKAIVLAHTLGNPFDVDRVVEFARAHDLWLIEDCCDAVGATYRGKSVGSFGDLATVSFYPAHHITTGEGGAVLVNSPKLRTIVESFRDWGRDCWCDPGKDDTCGKRYAWQLGRLPFGYDHKYTYSRIGYNLKVTDMQAAVGVAQLKKLPQFIAARRENFARLHDGLADLQHIFLLPRATDHSEPSWFGFPIAVRLDAGFRREPLLEFLNARKIGTRLLFAGNLIHQPAYRDRDYRVIGDLRNSDFVMNQVFWIGVYPGLTPAMIDFTLDSLHQFAANMPLPIASPGSLLIEDLEHVLLHTGEVWEELRGGRLLITGGTGFFGRWLLESFVHVNQRLGLDAQAVVLSRDPAAFARRMPHLAAVPAIECVTGDVRDFAFLLVALRTCCTRQPMRAGT